MGKDEYAGVILEVEVKRGQRLSQLDCHLELTYVFGESGECKYISRTCLL